MIHSDTDWLIDIYRLVNVERLGSPEILNDPETLVSPDLSIDVGPPGRIGVHDNRLKPFVVIGTPNSKLDTSSGPEEDISEL